MLTRINARDARHEIPVRPEIPCRSSAAAQRIIKDMRGAPCAARQSSVRSVTVAAMNQTR
jgi:hypothetical protein